MPFIQAREGIAADLSGRSPTIPLLTTVVSVLGVEELSPSMGSDLPRFAEIRGKARSGPKGAYLAVGYVHPQRAPYSPSGEGLRLAC